MNILIVVICLLIFIGAFVFLKISSKWPVSSVGADISKVCAVCGAKSQHDSQYGYSQHAEEDPAKMMALCRKCLIAQLEKDYASYVGRAVVIQPAVGPQFCLPTDPRMEPSFQRFEDRERRAEPLGRNAAAVSRLQSKGKLSLGRIEWADG